MVVRQRDRGPYGVRPRRQLHRRPRSLRDRSPAAHPRRTLGRVHPTRRLPGEPRSKELTAIPIPPEREELAGVLKRLRKAAKARDPKNYSIDALASRLGADLTVRASRGEGARYHFTRVSQIENNKAAVTVEEAVAWARDCGATDQEIERIRALADAAQDTRTVWTPDKAGSAPDTQHVIAAREDASRVLRSFSPAALTGLVQTRAYARAVYANNGIPDVEAAADARFARQAILADSTREITLLFTEGAIRYRPGPPALLDDQLADLARISRIPHVRVGVIPYDLDARTGYDNFFALYEDWANGEPAMVEVEFATGEVTSTRPSEVAAYRRRFAILEQSALTGDAAREFIRRVRSDLTA